MSTEPHRRTAVYLLAMTLTAACAEASPSEADTSSADTGSRPDAGMDTLPDDAQPPTDPVVDGNSATGNVTTYGSVSDPAPSQGGACNYGATDIYNFAAINVSISAGDERGQWDGGRICGQCARVVVSTREGEKSTVIRITDKCPDEYCGIDLGGLPAQTLMGTQPGRYDGAWELIPCDGADRVSDGPPSLFVKDGSNPWWALVQVRNPPAAVRSIAWSLPSGESGTFAYATEAENFYTVPEVVRTTSETVSLTIACDFNITLTAALTGSSLAVADALYEI